MTAVTLCVLKGARARVRLLEGLNATETPRASRGTWLATGEVDVFVVAQARDTPSTRGGKVWVWRVSVWTKVSYVLRGAFQKRRKSEPSGPFSTSPRQAGGDSASAHGELAGDVLGLSNGFPAMGKRCCLHRFQQAHSTVARELGSRTQPKPFPQDSVISANVRCVGDRRSLERARVLETRCGRTRLDALG